MLLLGRTAKRMRFNMLLPNFDLMKNQEKKEKKIQKKNNPKYKMIYMKEV
jgi:hypothetical protein